MELSKEVIDWLLGHDNPPVRYLTLTNLLKKSPNSAAVIEAKNRLMDYPVTQGILKHHKELWKDNDRSYWKYTSRYWQLSFLGQFLADGHDPRIARGAEGIMKSRKWIQGAGAQCLTANVLRSLRLLGYADHPVVLQETEILAQRLLEDGGIKCPAMHYSLLSHCYMALPKLLLCFVLVPVEKRSRAVREAITFIMMELLEKEVYLYVPGERRVWQKAMAGAPKRHDLLPGETVKGWIREEKKKFLTPGKETEREAKKGWLKFGFPLHYNSDVLEAMYALALAGAGMNPNLEKPLQVIQDKMTPSMQWTLENTLNGKMWMDVEEKGKPSKWITYFALFVLDHFNGF